LINVGREVAATPRAPDKVKQEIEKRSLRGCYLGHTDDIRFKRGATATTVREQHELAYISRNAISASKVLAADREPIAPKAR
jgi:hypothetical protein